MHFREREFRLFLYLTAEILIAIIVTFLPIAIGLLLMLFIKNGFFVFVGFVIALVVGFVFIVDITNRWFK